jgi:hypothetical protein
MSKSDRKPITMNTPWSEIPPGIRDAVLRDLHTAFGQHYAVQIAAMNTSKASRLVGEAGGGADGGLTRAAAAHAGEMMLGYRAALRALGSPLFDEEE